MLIDLAEEKLRRNERTFPLTLAEMMAPPDDIEEQIKLLDETCPRYDVNNIWQILSPDLIDTKYQPAQKRNADLREKRDSLLKIASRAPLGHPWDRFYFEFRLNDRQRAGFLVRWDAQNRRHKCSVLYESRRIPGIIELISDAFEILLSPDDMFSGYKFGRIPEGGKSSIEKEAELVRTAIGLLNWDREDVPTKTYTDEKHEKPKEKEAAHLQEE